MPALEPRGVVRRGRVRRDRVGLVGLGHMGRPIAARLRAGGVRLTVYDLRPETVREVAAACGAEPAVSLAALGRASEVVITLLPDGAAVRHAALGPGDCLAIDMGSSSPTGTRELAAALAAHGIVMIDAPVSGGVRGAEAGTLAIMVGGDPDVVTACRPLLELVGKHVLLTGVLGSGHAMKALNNLVSAAGLLAAGEALVIGSRFGLDARVMLDALNASSGRNYATEQKLAQFVLSRTYAAGFSLALMLKDLRTALGLAESTATPAPFGAECLALWTRAAAALETDADHTAIVRWLEMVAGSEL
jgi:3-hydroxyisobutyrate dehydrogenase